ncbi:amino acid permease/ SLC12A domain-containing protein [Globomyces pollinis-pini]|nr:amino acid permease/ SLC12A domain-containing protein [Globomyces pollinis-pini]KAJ3000210.1 hypothetical protein HDV02_000123 [Globomyces sp. JEL0801]
MSGKNLEENNVEVEDGMKRGLKNRHIQMIAIGGTIGTGLFIGSGEVLKAVGPMGILISYAIAGMIVFCVIMSLGEMATLIPVSGSFNEYAARFHSPALGFMSSWAYWFNWAMTLPIELQAAGSFLGFWFPSVPPVVFYLGILFLLMSINLFTVKGFGEVEYWLSILKIKAIFVFFFAGIFVIFRDQIGFVNYSKAGGAMAGTDFWGIVNKLPAAVFAFGGTELVGITAGEAANPRKSVPAAIRGTFWRITIFYFLTVFVMGIVLPSDYAESLHVEGDHASSILSSPFVAVMQVAKIPYAADYINFIAFIAVFSAGSSSLYATSRTMISTCQAGYGPEFLTRTSSGGVPVVQVLFASAFGLISILTTVIGAEVIFTWLINLVGNLIGVSWVLISIAHIYFRKAYLAQGNRLEDLPYRSPIGVMGDYFSLFFNCFVLLFAGITGYIKGDPFELVGFISSYVYLLLLIVLYVIGGVLYGFGRVPSEQVDLKTGHVSKYDHMYKE